MRISIANHWIDGEKDDENSSRSTITNARTICPSWISDSNHDTWLWSAAPTHAFGLTGFVLIDILLAVVVLTRKATAAIGAAFISIVQFGAMIADSTIGQPIGVPAAAFRSYLLNDLSYTLLLGVQMTILAFSVALFAIPFLHRHVRPGLALPRRSD